MAMHGHDFAEICWVESGVVVHDTPRGSRRLAVGEAVLVRPGQHHALRGQGFIVNVAVSAATLADLEARYGEASGWPWHAADEPATARLDAADLAELARRVDALHAGPGDRLAREAFLIDLLARLRPRGTGLWTDAPAWLAVALERLAEPPHLGQGLPVLVRLTGRSREHLSRTI
jgi:AraC family cel operon transcriptional repressor